MSANLAFFILVVLLVVGWFALGTQFNVRKGHSALRWLQEGLPLLGEKTSLRWLGSSVVELKINQAKAPFRQAEVLLVLEPRDVPPLWALARLRGRCDLFIFRGTLRSQPGAELEVLDPSSWSARGMERLCQEHHWTRLPMPAPLVAYAPGQAVDAARVLQAAELPGCPLVRLSLRRTEPEFEVHWRLNHLRKHPSPTVFATLRRITGCL
jgi:hypothetical protein